MVAAEFPEIILIRNNRNLGFARANNQGAARATGRYLFFLNNDTVVPPGTLAQLVTFAVAHPEAGLVGPRLRDAEGNIQVSYRCQPSLGTLLHRTTLLRWTGFFRLSYRQYRRQEFDPDHTRTVDVLMGAAILARRDRFLTWGGWDEDFPFGGEDLELSARVRRFAPLIYWPEVEVLHYGRTSTRQHVPAWSQIQLGMARYLRKSGVSRLELLAYKGIITLDAPVTLLAKTAEYLLRRLQGRATKARKSSISMRCLWYFLNHGLVDFWRA
jgi:GT2 family glycosyltransferase